MGFWKKIKDWFNKEGNVIKETKEESEKQNDFEKDKNEKKDETNN